MRDYLFGFSTTRNALALSPEIRDRFHVHMIESDRVQTHYWSEHPRGGFSVILRRIRQRADQRDSMPSLAELKEEFADFLAFFRGAKSEERRVDLSDLPELAAGLGLGPLVPSQRVILWDALAEALWVRPSKSAVDVIRSIFLADLVLNGLEDISAEALAGRQAQADLRRMLNGMVVLPLPLDNQSTQRRYGVMNARQRDMLEAAHDQIIAATEARRLYSARQEFQLAHGRLQIELAPRPGDAPDEGRNEEGPRVGGPGDFSAIPPRDERARRPDPPVLQARRQATVASVLERVGSASARATLQPLQAQTLSIRDLEEALDTRIIAAEQAAEGAPEVVAYSAFYALGMEFAVEERIPKGAIIVKAHANAEGGSDLYLTYFHGRSAPMLIEVTGRLIAQAAETEIAAELLDTEDDRFQTFRVTRSPIRGLFADVELALRTALPGAPLANIEPMRVTTQVPRFDLPDLTEAPVISQQPQPLFGINRLGLIEYRRVEQEVACYVTGLVSKIESIPARTFKRRNTRSFARTEVEQDITQELSSERQTETEATEKLEMQTQIQQTLREEQGKSFDFGTGLSVELPGAGSLTTETGFNFNSQSSKEDATTQSLQLARQITQKVAEKLVQKTTSRRRSLSQTEAEDIVEQGFDNRMGEDHVVCVYRWVDKIMNNYLVNYGRMEVIEFEVPEPARQWIAAQHSEREEQEFTRRRPRRPRSMGLRGPKSITIGNYRRFAKAYGIDLDPPPQPKIRLAQAYADGLPILGENDEGTGPDRGAAWNDLTVPEGYRAVRATVEISFEDLLLEQGNPMAFGGYPYVSVGGSAFHRGDLYASQELENLEGTIPVSIRTYNVGALALQVRIECALKPRYHLDWQMKSYTKLLEAYRAQKAEYDAALAEHKSEADASEADLNPRHRKKVMERELKRICISMLADQLQLNISADHYGAAADGDLPPINFGPGFERHAELVRFLEQSVMWNLMSYIFYPYFYADKESWREKLSMEETRNRLFAAFLSAGMGRVVVPVRPGFEAAFNYFLHTGIPWFGEGLALQSEDDLFLSLADELSTGAQEVEIEGRWQTKLPTNLTILQDAAGAMIGEGLPCEIDENRIGMGQSRLGPVLPPSEGADISG